MLELDEERCATLVLFSLLWITFSFFPFTFYPSLETFNGIKLRGECQI